MKQSAFIFLNILLISNLSLSGNPANNTLQRVLGDDASRFTLVEIDNKDENDWYEIQVKNGGILVKGNSPVALCKGVYAYIIDNGYGVISWEGTHVAIPEKLEDKKYDRVSSSVPLRMYLNPCTYGYTAAWWDWPRWEQELDWMAMHGINMPIALLGQEIIWQEVWEEMGIEKAQLQDYYCGPAFLPWFRMGNLYNHYGPLPQSWMEKDRILQGKIMKRIKELGMQAVVPAFSGHVPPFFTKKFPDSKTYKLENWGGIEAEKASYLLDPKDSLFSVIGKRFLRKYEETYGKADLFLADAFNEMLPPVSEENKNAELAEYGEAIYKGIREHNPDATWVIQGWTFGYQSYFWNPQSTRAFFSKIPKDNFLMLNYSEDRHMLWEKLDAFYGFKWTYGYVHNYGGQQALFGDLNFYHDKYEQLMNSAEKGNLVGYGCLPEAIEHNAIVYDYMFDVPWGGTKLPVTEWVDRYIANRYGKLSPKVSEAWRIAVKNTYSVKGWHTNSNGYGTYIHNNRPSFDLNIKSFHGNPESMNSVLSLLLDEYELHNESELYIYDLLDFAQHYAAYLADFHLVKTAQNYMEMDFEAGDMELEKTRRYFEKLELLQVATGGSFTKWCEDAVAHATSEEEEKLYLANAKAQITIWGGNRLKDYASKSWSGILLDFYFPRWQLLFDDVKNDMENFDILLTQKKIIKWEEQWIWNESIPESPEMLKKEEYIELIKSLLTNDTTN